MLGPEADSRGAADVRAVLLTIATTSGTGRVLDLEQLPPSGLAATAGGSSRWTGRGDPGRLDLAGGHLAGRGESRLPLVVRPRPAESGRPAASRADRPLPSAGRAGDHPSGPDGRRARPAPASDVARAPPVGRPGVAWGGAGVFRFSPASVRRGFDAGWAAAEIHAWLEQHSATGVPQPLRYLVDDVARQFGSIRIGSAETYLRSDDPAQTAALLAHPEAAYLGLREITPPASWSATRTRTRWCQCCAAPDSIRRSRTRPDVRSAHRRSCARRRR